MHTERTTGRTSCSTRQARKRDQENYGKCKGWPARTFPRATRKGGSTAPKVIAQRLAIETAAYCSCCLRILYSRGIFGGFMRNQNMNKQKNTAKVPTKAR